MRSAVIAAYEYDASTETPTIRYHSGNVYNYLRVPKKIFATMRATMIKGIWFNQHIKGQYHFEEITPGLQQGKLFGNDAG